MTSQVHNIDCMLQSSMSKRKKILFSSVRLKILDGTEWVVAATIETKIKMKSEAKKEKPRPYNFNFFCIFSVGFILCFYCLALFTLSLSSRTHTHSRCIELFVFRNACNVLVSICSWRMKFQWDFWRNRRTFLMDCQG